MKKPPPVALVCAGPISRTALERLPRLREELGYVKAVSFRLASRYVNTLGAGTPARTYEDISHSSLVLINVPNAATSAVITEMSSAKVTWIGKHVSLYQSLFDTSILRPFEERGATTSTLGSIGSYKKNEFLVEGSSDAARALKTYLLGRSASTIIIEQGRKGDYLKAEFMASDVFPSLIAEIVEALRRAGIPKHERERLTEVMLANALTAYLRVGSRSVRLNLDWQRWLNARNLNVDQN